MKKQIKIMTTALAVCLALCLLPFMARAATVVDSGDCGDGDSDVRWTLDSDGVLTISGSGAMAHFDREGYEVYNEVDDCYDWVTYVTSPWYDYRNDIRAVVIENGVTNVGMYAFADCAALTEATLPASVRTLAYAAFSGCESLTELAIPETVTGLGSDLFQNCVSLTAVNIPARVNYIGSWTFGYCSSLTEIVIPDSVDTIADAAFYGCSSLTEIVVPDSVTTIGSNAFYSCANLAAVTLPDGITDMGSNVFAETAWWEGQPDGPVYLNHVLYGYRGEMPADTTVAVAPGTTVIAGCAFVDRPELVGVTIPDSVVCIGESAFSGCTGLTEAALPKDVVELNSNLFANCTSLERVTLSEKTVLIDSGVFCGCSALTDIALTPSVVYIGSSAFSWCTALTDIALPQSLSMIGYWAFESCTGLTTLTIPDSVYSIGYGAFYGCAGLTEAVLPEGIWSLPEILFEGCDNLAVVTIPAGVEYIEDSAIPEGVAVRCPVGSYAQEWAEDQGRAYTLYITAPKKTYAFAVQNGITVCWSEVTGATQYNVYRYSSAKKAYVYQATVRSALSYTDTGLTEGVTYYYKIVAVYKTAGLTVTSDMSASAYAKVAAVTASGFCGDAGYGEGSDESVAWSLTADGTLTISGSGAIADYDCYEYCDEGTEEWRTSTTAPWGPYADEITAVNVKKGVTAVGAYAFAWLERAAAVSLPDGLFRIGWYAFNNCRSLTAISLPDSVSYVESDAFGCCDALASVRLSHNLYSISSWAFWNCPMLTSVVIPDNVNVIDSYAFYNCTALAEITFPQQLDTVGYQAFGNTAWYEAQPDGFFYIGTILNGYKGEMPAGTVLTAAPGTTAISENAFWGCENLTGVILPDSIRQIDNNTFGCCYGLTSVTLPERLEAIYHGAFYECTSLKTIYIPRSVYYISDEDDVFPAGTVLCGEPRSSAQRWAEDHGRTFAVQPAVPVGVTAEAVGTNAIAVRWAADAVATQHNVYRYNSAKKTYRYLGTVSARAADPNVYLDEGLTVSAVYSYKVVAVNKSAAYTVVSEMSEAAEAQAGMPHAPADVTAVPCAAGQIRVSWSAEESATQYNVYRYNSAKDKFAYLGTTSASAAKPTQYTDTGLTAGEEYVYYVVAVNKSADYKLVSGASGQAAAVAVGKPAAPANVRAISTGEAQITVFWDAVEDATQCNIYRWDDGKGAFAYKGTVRAAATQYTDKELATGADYTYKVVAVNKTADYTIVGDWSEAVVVMAGMPAVPTGVQASATALDQLTVTWDAVANATQYNVYRSVAGKAFSYKATVSASSAHPTRYIDKGLEVGVAYAYQVVAVRKTADYTWTSERSEAANAVAGRPNAPENIRAVPSAACQLTVSWDAAALTTQYNVYRFNDAKGRFVYIGTTRASAAQPTQYTDAGLTAGAEYTYYVVAVNKSADYSLVSDASAEASAVAVGKPAVPANVRAGSGAGRITVAWSAVEDATQYNVYRSVEGGAFSYKGTVYADAVNPTQYIDRSVTVGTAYAYKVVAVNKTADYTIVGDMSPAASAVGARIVAGGYCGAEWEENNDVSWTLDSNGLLTVSGNGRMVDYYEDERENYPWYNDSDNITGVVIEYGVTGIGDFAFADCANLVSLTIADSVTDIGSLAFNNCGSLASAVLPNGLTYLGWGVFYECSSLAEVSLPDDLETIADHAFYSCSSLSSVALPDGLAYIGSYAFSDCAALAELTIPDGVTTVGENAFSGTAWLANAPQGPLYVGKAFYCYIGDMPADTVFSVRPGTTQICASAFSYQENLTGVLLPDSVASIDNNAFYQCAGLTELVIPDGVTQISYCAFCGCVNLTSITLPDGLTGLGFDAFWDCASLTSVTLPQGLPEISGWLFENCSSLTEVVIPDSVRYIYGYAFYGCDSLTTLTIPATVEYIEETPETIPENTVICGAAGSCAQAWAENYGRSFGVIPNGPDELTAAADADGAVTLTWNACANATQYNIYRRTAPNGAYAYKGTVRANAANPTQYVDNSVKAGTAYEYYVVAVNKTAAYTLVSGVNVTAAVTP